MLASSKINSNRTMSRRRSPSSSPDTGQQSAADGSSGGGHKRRPQQAVPNNCAIHSASGHHSYGPARPSCAPRLQPAKHVHDFSRQ
jgi:hypothetical protein